MDLCVCTDCFVISYRSQNFLPDDFEICYYDTEQRHLPVDEKYILDLATIATECKSKSCE